MSEDAAVGTLPAGLSVGDPPREDPPGDRSAAIVAAALDGIVTLDQRGRVVDLNPACRTLFGWTREEALGLRLDELLDPAERTGATLDGIRPFATTGEGADHQRYERPAVRRDGTELLVEVVAVPTEHQGRRELTCFIRDVTDVHRTHDRHRERRLADATAQMRTLIDNLGSAVLLEDDTRRVLVANDVLVNLFGLPVGADDLVGSDSSQLAQGIRSLFRDPDAFVAGVDQRVAMGIPILGEQLSLVDGSTLERDYLPIDSAGRHAGHLWVYRDITQHIAERQMLTDQNRSLAELAALKNEFVATVSHELRTPLTSVVSFAEMLKDPSVGSLTDEQATFLEIIDRNSLRLLRLIEDLLLVAKLESRTLPLSLSPVDLPEIVGQVVTELTPRARERGVELSVTTSEGPTGRGDWVRLQQVVSNLVGNAISYTLPGGTVHVVADLLPETGHWSITVSDTGVGIPPEEIPHVFDAFFRASTASGAGGAGASGGTGLGLAISRLVVEQHHGRISVQSPPGVGTTVTVRLPYEDAYMARILVVEDNPDIALALSVLLQRSGHEVSRAVDGVEALRVAYDLHPQLVVLDLGLPRLDGWAVLSRIRELSDVPVLLLTAAGRDEDKVRGLRAGADDYLTKPFHNAELVARVDGLLRRAGHQAWNGSDLGHGVVVLSPTRHAVTVDGDDVAVTPLEFGLLSMFLRHESQVLTPTQILASVWNDHSGTGQERVKFAVLRLRRKLGWDDTATSPLKSVRGIGYRLDPPA